MAKIVYASLKNSKPFGSTSQPRSRVTSKSVIGPDGKKMLVRVVDANSSTFGQDLRDVFGKNVSEARRDNKRVLEAMARASTET